MKEARFRFFGRVNDFLAPERRGVEFSCAFQGNQSVKHLIESLGVPHPEVGSVAVNGAAADFSYLVQDGDGVEVREAAGAPEARFVLDTHLGRLAAYLRMLGFDTLHRNDYGDEELARVAGAGRRILLTRDRGLLMRSAVLYGYYVRETDPRHQLAEVARRFGLAAWAAPFSRCLRCNGVLQAVPRQRVIDRVPPRSREHYDQFHQCPGCGRVYWNGSHHRRMEQLVGEVVGGPSSC